MDDQKFDVIQPVPTGSSKKQGRSYGLSHMVATSACAALATAGIALAVGNAQPKPSAPEQTAQVVATEQAATAPSPKDEGEQSKATSGNQHANTTSKETKTVGENINKTAEAEAAEEAAASTPVVQVVAVPVQAQSDGSGSSSNANEQAKEPVWVPEVGHWDYTTVTDYEERSVYKDVPNYVDTIVYYCSDHDFESTDVSEVIAHCEAHGTSIRSEVRQTLDGTRKEADGTEMVAVGSHQELGEWVVDVPGHWE